MEEPMDIDALDTDFDNKENTIHHNNVLPRTPSTEKGYEELDVSELNMKLRYSITPASSPMSKSFNVNCTENKLNKDANVPIIENCHMTRSLNTTNVILNDTLKSPQTQPLQALSTELHADNTNKSVLQRLDSKCIDNVTITLDTVQDDENLSFPSTSSSQAHTPDAITPTKEMSKEDGGSPIMRGLKTVFSMFRPSQSPITPTEEKPPTEITLPDTETQKLLASTPISSQKYKESTSTKSPYKESIKFTDDLEKELQWKDETTIIFSQEKIPIHKLFPEEKPLKLLGNKREVLDDSVEFMDVSYNDSALGDITITNNQSMKTVNKNEMTLGDSDSEFVDCETTFTKDNSLLEYKKCIQDVNENAVAKEESQLSYQDQTNKNVTDWHKTQNNTGNKTYIQEENMQDNVADSHSNIEKYSNNLDLTISNSTVVPENNITKIVSTDLISATEEKPEETKLECIAENKLSDETIKLDMTNNFESNNYTIPNDQNSTIDILTSIENITEENEEHIAITISKNNWHTTENIESDNCEITLPTDIPLPEEDETDTIVESGTNSPLNNDIINEANEENKLNIPTKQCEITDENLNLNNTITEPENNSVVLSDVRTSILPEENKEQNEGDAQSTLYNEDDKLPSSEIVKVDNEVESQKKCFSEINFSQSQISEHVQNNNLLIPCEKRSDISQTNTLETVEKLINDSRDDKQTEMQILGLVPEHVCAVVAEVLNNEEEVILSENDSPYVSLSAGTANEPECQQKLVEEVEKVETPFTKVADSPPSSPKIISRGNYNFNFDEMDDPFATKTKTKIRASTSPEKGNMSIGLVETVFNINQEMEIKDSSKTKDKSKSQHVKRKSGNDKKTSNKLHNDICDNEENNDHNETGKQDEQLNPQVDQIDNNDKIVSDLSKADVIQGINQGNSLHVTENVISSEVIEEQNDIVTEANTSIETTESRPEHTPYVKPSESIEYNLPKNVFNIPEIEHSGFNPFATVSKMRHSPDKSTDNAFDNKTILNESHEDLNCTSSSKVTDGKNVTVREINTEDEDTIEGPFLEADELYSMDKISDFDGEKVDMIQFSDINHDEIEENEEGEMFIDAEAFEFLLNQNKAMVADSGKESLFLKFDPLFAKRMSMIQETQGVNKQPIKQSSIDSTVTNISSVPGPSNVMDMSYEITKDATFEEKCDESMNNTITKPTMVVTPAVNPAVSPRNKTITPTRSNRRSFTFTSPAIAVIDRLLSMSANNSILGQDSTLIHVSNEQHEAELALTQLRELLAEKEISVHELKCESNELKFRLETLESQTKKLEEESKERLENINSLNEKLAEKTRDNKNMAVVVEEYERTIASLIAEKEQERRLREEERMKLIRERDEQTAHLANMECSFNDLHSKYEKSKGIIMSYKANEDTYRKTIKDFESNFAKVQNNYELLKQHATSKLNHANQELEKINRSHEADVLKLHAMLKRKEVEITSLEESLAQKTKANDELAAICDELINKTGTSTEAGSLRGVAMATSDKHCQTAVKQDLIIEVTTSINNSTIIDRRVTNLVRDNVPGMFDESVPVVNAREIESPPSSGEEEEVVKATMSKFNPPVRHTARHDFDSESDSDSEAEKFLENLSGEDQSPDRKTSEKSFEVQKPMTRESRSKPQQKRDISSNSESDSVDLEAERVEPLAGSGRKRGGAGVVVPAEGAYDPKHFQDLKVSPDMENIFQYIMKYTPQKIDIDLKLQPFVPDYVPAVGDIDAFVKVNAPACNVTGEQLDDALLQHIDNLGLSILDEPSSEQSDSALLHLQLRALTKITSNKTTVLAKKVENAEKNPKAIDRWIKDVSELHLSKPPPTVNYTNKMPDIDSLMEEWPESMEEALNQEGVPPASIDCSLQQYVELTCGLFDVPIHGDTLNDRIQALHLLFSLYSAVRNSQLYAERQKDKIEEV